MKPRPVDLHRVAAGIRRHAVVGVLLSAAIAAPILLVALDAGDRHAAAAREADQALAAAADRAAILLEQDRRVLDRLGTIGAAATTTEPNAPAASPLPTPVRGVRGAILLDPTGAVVAAAGGGFDAALADEAVRAAAAAPGTAVVTRAMPARQSAPVGLARAWLADDGALGGVALIALDRDAFAGLDIRRADGAALFDDDDPVERDAARYIEAPVSGVALTVRHPAAAANPTPILARLAIAAAGIAALIAAGAIAVLRVRAARRSAAAQAAAARALCEDLAALRAAADRHDLTSRSQARFFAETVHELRTPLNSILGFAETIRQEMFGPVGNPRYREYADLIRDAGSHLLSLTNDLLDSARIEAGRMEIAPIRMSAAALARSALDLVELSAQRRGIALTVTGETTCPDLRVDPRAFRQVMVNLLANAIKFTPTGGRIDIAFAAAADGGATIAVGDTGIGMSAAEAGAAFEPYGRGDQARGLEGTGLGLSLARALVRLHGGEVTLTSRPAAGTTVTVSLPPGAVFASGLGAPDAGSPAGGTAAAAHAA